MAPNDRGRIWVGDLLPECEEQDLREYFSKFGQVREIKVEREKRTGLSRSFGFLSMGSQMLVDKILKDKHEIWEHAISVKLASDVKVEPEPKPEPEAGDEPKEKDEKSGEKRAADISKEEAEPGKFFVSGLEEGATEETLRSHFESFGELKEVSLAKDAQGKSKNYGFVIFANGENDDLIVESDHEISGKKVEVKRCKKSAKRAKADTKEPVKPGQLKPAGVRPSVAKGGPADRAAHTGKGAHADPKGGYADRTAARPGGSKGGASLGSGWDEAKGKGKGRDEKGGAKSGYGKDHKGDPGKGGYGVDPKGKGAYGEKGGGSLGSGWDTEARSKGSGWDSPSSKGSGWDRDEGKGAGAYDKGYGGKPAKGGEKGYGKGYEKGYDKGYDKGYGKW